MKQNISHTSNTSNTFNTCDTSDINLPPFSAINLIDAKRVAYQQLKTAFWAKKICHGHGFLDALEEAQELVLAAAGLNYQDIEQTPEFWQSKLTQPEQNWLEQALKERIEQQKPLPYLTKRSYLQGLEFYIDERALIPRSFIAELLQNGAFDYFLKNIENDDFKILELCTGSGCLAILAACVYEHAQVEAIDISIDALAVAAINQEKYQPLDREMAARINFYQSDLYKNVQGKFDIIITNPPYVCQASMDCLPAEYQHEPALALAGGEDGMDLVKKIISDAAKYLKPHGFLVVEIGNEYAYAMALFQRLGLKNVFWLEVSAGNEQVFLIKAADLLNKVPYA